MSTPLVSAPDTSLLYGTKIQSTMQKIAPCLWCNNNVEEMMDFYLSVFKNSKTVSVGRYGEGGPGPAGSILVGFLELEGLQVMLLNGGPQFQYTEAVSLLISCDTQEEIDYYWERFSEGGKPGPCGWIKDKFGFSWQVAPAQLGQFFSSGEAAKDKAALQAMMGMGKLDTAALQAARDNA